MGAFEDVHAGRITGSLAMFDRMIFKGHLNALYKQDGARCFLWTQGVALKDFTGYAKATTERIANNARKLVTDAGRPVISFDHVKTRNRAQHKGELAKSIAEGDGITEVIICLISAVESCYSFQVRKRYETGRLELFRRERKCVHHYLYLVDPEFGFMHVRLQGWIPYECQIYVNGREWLARALDRAGIGYVRYDNSPLAVDDLDTAAELCDRFAHKAWPRVLNAFARRLNPILAAITAAGYGGYYWVLDQAEIATDVMFTTRPQLLAVWPDLVRHATLNMSSEDVLGFLGRKLHPSLQAQVVTDAKRRPQGWRIRHRMAGNWVKVYDKASVLRVETTINNPGEFKIQRVVTDADGQRSRQWCPMRKGVSDLWRNYQVGIAANHRYLDALAAAPLKGEGVAALDALWRPRTNNGRRYARFSPLNPTDLELFRGLPRVWFTSHVGVSARRKDVAMPKKFPPEFKRDVVSVARRGDLTVNEVAADFDIAPESVRRWMRQADVDDGIKDGLTTAEQAEVVRLRRENRRLEMENEILRRAAAYFAKDAATRQPHPQPAIGGAPHPAHR